MASEKLTDPARSEVDSVLKRLVNECFDRDLADFDSFGRRETMRVVLNQHYVWSKSHSARNLFLCLPLVILFPNMSTEQCTLVAMLSKLLKMLPSPMNVAREAWEIMRTRDPEL